MISIIVPVYNTEKYLYKCCDSILKQEYNDYEVLLIDDGSTDQSANICDYYASIDNRFKVIHKTNSGVSSTRNLGIEKSTGEFITFIDSDDYIAIDYLNQLIKHNSYDLVVGGSTNINKNDEIISYSLNNQIKVEENDNFIKLFNTIDKSLILDAPWNKLFRRSIIMNSNIRFNTDLNYGEDKLFILNYIIHCRNIIQLKNNSYYYRNEQDKKYILSSEYRLKWVLLIEKSYNQLYKKYNIAYPYSNCDSFKTFLIHNLSLYIHTLFKEKQKLTFIINNLGVVFNLLEKYKVARNNCNSKKTLLLYFLYKYRLPIQV